MPSIPYTTSLLGVQALLDEYPKNMFSGAKHGFRNEDMLYQSTGNKVLPIIHRAYGEEGEVEFHSVHLKLHTGVTTQNPTCAKELQCFLLYA